MKTSARNDTRPSSLRRKSAAKVPVLIEIKSRDNWLAAKAAAPSVRLEALKFVFLFVGDIHQPLYYKDNHDRGGNDVHLEFAGRSTNLHAV